MGTRKLGFLFNQNYCIGCKACEIACQVYHTQDPEMNWRHVDMHLVHEDGLEKELYLSHSCQHCDDPACLNVCPVGAYTKLENGAVVQDHDKCIGCGYCVVACPYHAISKDTDGQAQKCNLCAERLERGQEPACVERCPLDVLKLVDTDEADSDGMEKEMPHFPYLFTHPNIRFYPRADRDNFTY